MTQTILNPNAANTPPLAYSVHGFSRATGLSQTRTYDLIRRGELRAMKLGTRSLIPFEEATRFLASLSNHSPTLSSKDIT